MFAACWRRRELGTNGPLSRPDDLLHLFYLWRSGHYPLCVDKSSCAEMESLRSPSARTLSASLKRDKLKVALAMSQQPLLSLCGKRGDVFSGLIPSLSAAVVKRHVKTLSQSTEAVACIYSKPNLLCVIKTLLHC